MSHEKFGSSFSPQYPNQEELKKTYLDMLKHNGIIPDADKPWNVMPQEGALSSPKSATKIRSHDELHKTSSEVA